jgi:trans-aconitate methyltransferase
MRLRDPDSRVICSERDVYTELLPLADARVAELGCGRAELTRAIAEEFPTAQIIALEVDTVQHARNLAITDLPNVRFVAGGAEALPLDDDSVDLVLMFKSLHHVPSHLLDTAHVDVIDYGHAGIRPEQVAEVIPAHRHFPAYVVQGNRLAQMLPDIAQRFHDVFGALSFPHGFFREGCFLIFPV